MYGNFCSNTVISSLAYGNPTNDQRQHCFFPQISSKLCFFPRKTLHFYHFNLILSAPNTKSMAEIKTLLKEARKLIEDNNYKEAQECCKAILRKDKQNYFGLVLLGKSLQDSDQAPLAYQKAIATKPDQPLAWLGLANYYERKDDNDAKTKLFAIYNEILNLQIEEDKALEVISKLGQLGCSLKCNESIKILLKYLNKELDMKLRELAEKKCLDILNADILCSEEDIPLVLKVLQNIHAKDPNDSIELLHCKVLLQKTDFRSAVQEVIHLKFFDKNVIVREHLCKYLCKKYVEYESFNNFPIEDYVDKITEGIENSKYPNLLRSMICYDKCLFVEAYKQCVPLINYHEADVTEASFIIKCTMKLKKWSFTQKLTTNFLTKVKEQAFFIELKRLLFFSLVKQKKWVEAISIAKQIPPQSLSLNEQAMLVECYIETNQNIDNVMVNLKSTKYYIQLQALSLLKKEKYSDTVALLENADEDALNLFYLGKAYWELKQYDKSLVSLLRAAKIDSEYAYTFVYLGHFYNYYKKDLEKAKKCYEKAYSLNNTDEDIVKNLSTLYVKLDLKESDFELLNAAQKNIQTNTTWINFRLGLHYLTRRDWENAIINFRHVIKTNPDDVTAIECLADSYYSRGSFMSALKAYNKVITLNPSKSSYSLTRMGNIHSILNQYEDAIAAFEKVFQIDPYSILALKGIAETWMQIAKKQETSKIYGNAKDCAQHAVNYITKAISVQRKFSCFWKMLGDTFMFITRLPDKYAYVYVKKTYDDSNETFTKVDKQDIFLQAISCYAYIAKQNQELASYDLALAYLEYFNETKKTEYCNIAFNLTVTCIKENPSDWNNWNLLGKICICMNRYDFAQHCFIKALSVTRKGEVAKIWCNLGTMYLKLKLYQLANYCFWRGQSTLPSYPHSWIGQALIAEEIREEEALDLFRHASCLGYHPESALGYADWVCRSLKKQDCNKNNSVLNYDIEGLHAIPCAMDLIEWFSHFEPNNACACTILGILQERSGLIRAALKSYERSLEYASEDKKNIVLLNIGRVLIRLEKYDEAIKVYKAVTEASLNSTSGLALALFKKGLYEEAYSAYDTALHWLSNDDVEKADLLVAMAGIVYMFKGADDAKTLLFHSIQISQKKPTAYSLFSICSLGLIHSDQSLSKLALSELQRYEKDSSCGFDIGFLKSYLLVSQDNMRDAIKSISDSLHDHPSNALLWFCMAQYLLTASNIRARAASSCSQRALCSAQYSQCCDSAKMIAIASMAEHVAGDRDKAFSLAKKGLHMYPNQAEIWAALLLSILSHRMWTERKDWILSATGHMRKRLDISRPLNRWLVLLEKKLQVAI